MPKSNKKEKKVIEIVSSPRPFETVGEAVRFELLQKLDRKIPSKVMPQKLQEDLNDCMENLQIALEQASDMSYKQGVKDGFNLAKKFLSSNK